MKLKKLVVLFLCLSIALTAVFLPVNAEDSQNITVTLTASMYGNLLNEATLVPIELSGKETYNLDDVFLAAHTLYYDGEDGYASENGEYGAYITKFWGDESGNFGYQINGGTKYVGGLDTTVENGDYIDVAIYENKYPDTEVYTKFDAYKKEAYIREEIELTLYQAGYDENWNTVFTPCEEVTVVADGIEYITDSEGKINLSFDEAGTYIVTACETKIVKDAEVAAITAPVCEITVKSGYSTIMDNIADKYSSEAILSDGNMIWFLADLEVYNRLYPEKGKVLAEDIKQQCIDKIVSDSISSSKPTVLAKSILALRALGYDPRQIYDKSFNKTDLVAKLTDLIDEKAESVTDIYTISYVLLALNQGEGYISDEQVKYLLDEIVANKKSWQENEWGTDAATAMLLALTPYYDEKEEIAEVIDETISIIKNAQSETGAIGNAASTGLAMVAFSAFGIDSSDIITNEKSLTDGLMGMAAESFDGFEPMENSFSTEQGFRGLLALELLKKDMGIMYDFKDNSMNPVWVAGEPAGCPVVFSSSIEEIKIEISGIDSVEEGRYDLAEGTYSYTASAKGYETYTGTFLVSSEEAENHILKKIDVSLEEKEESYGGGSGGGFYIDKKDKDKTSEKITDIELSEEKDEEAASSEAEFGENTYDDVKSTDWYYESVKYVHENKLMQGTENGFEPNEKMTRAMLVTVLFRMEKTQEMVNENKFSDISENAWYYDAVIWAAKCGIVSGVSEHVFAPDENITREQIAVIMYRYAQLKGFDVKNNTELAQYKDARNISSWALDALKWANGAEIIKGTSDTEILPESTATRSQVATILMRFCERFKK